MRPIKALPVVIRAMVNTDDRYEVLAFVHPLAGKQLVKGTIEVGESVAQACERELSEESGLRGRSQLTLGQRFIAAQGIHYGFCLMAVEQPLADKWDFFCHDDGGHQFSFFWQPLDEILDQNWHPIFQEAVEFIRTKQNVIEGALSEILAANPRTRTE